MWRKLLSLLLVLTLAVPALSPNISEAKALDRNILQNPGFENEREGWEIGGVAGIQTNNPHSGTKGFWTDNDSSLSGKNYVQQEVTVPYNGTYKTSAYLATGGKENTFGVRSTNGDILEMIILPEGATYKSPFVLEPITLRQDDKVIVYSNGGKGWLNGDDFSFEYDPSSVVENIMNQDKFNQMVRIPESGDYILTAMVSGTGEVVITAGDMTENITATEELQEIQLVIPGLDINDEIIISATEGAVVTDYSLKLDVSQIENMAPVAVNVAVYGNLWSDQTLIGDYTFEDEDEGQIEGNSIYQWLASETEEGDYTAINGATKKTLILTDDLEGKYVKFAVTPKDNLGLAGGVYESDPSSDMVKINYVDNYSFDIVHNGGPLGWKFIGGSNAINNKMMARTEFVFGRLPANSPNAVISYEFTVDKTAKYDLSMYINAETPGTEIGVRYVGSSGNSAIKSMQNQKNTSGYEKVTLTDILLEKNAKVEVYAKGGTSTNVALIEDVEMFANSTADLPDMVNLFSFKVGKQIGNTEINYEEKTILFKVPNIVDVTSLNVTMEVSEGASIFPSPTEFDFKNPVKFTISNGDVSDEWTITCTKMEKTVAVNSSNEYLQDAFNWAANTTKQFVMTGKSGQINKDEYGPGTGPLDYNPSYWAGYYDRSAYYSRDFAHQAAGAQMTGLDEENFNMFKTFAKNSTESRKWYTIWAFNFDDSIFALDYRNDNTFVRLLPSQFELVQKGYELYRWSGDEKYINDEEIFNFYTKVMTDFITLHDTNGNGVAEGSSKGSSIWDGSATYYERADYHAIEAGDSIGSQYQATLAYAGILKARGDDIGEAEWSQKAADLKTYFNEEWSVEEGNEGYARVLTDKGTKLFDFGNENSWFMPMKLITEPGERTDKYMEFIEENLGTGMGSTPQINTNIEAFTYIPDMYFPYNKADLAWKWMKYIIDVKDLPHERPVQGTNGDYPEVSYTFVSQVIEGMMGIEPNAGEHFVVTAPRLPSEVNDAEALFIPFGEHEINVKHTGLTQTQITNISSKDLIWEARFYGDYNKITVGEQVYTTKQKDINGVQVSYATITVPANGTLEAVATFEEVPGDTYALTITAGTGGSITTGSNGNYEAGTTIALVAQPNSGYSFKGWASTNNGIFVNDKNASTTFTMPANETTIIATFTYVGSSDSGNNGGGENTTPKPTPTPKPTEPVEPTKPETSKVEFSDIADHWAQASINKAGELGFVIGYKDGTFKPNGTVTRGEFASMLSRALNLDTTDSSLNFTDNGKTPAWAQPFIQAVANAGFISGYEDGTFRANNKLTRTELVVIIVRALDLEINPDAKLMFDDADQIPEWAKPYIATAAEAGLVEGNGDGKFNPNGSSSRAEAVTLLLAMLNSKK